MKKIAILLMISIFVFTSCSKDEPTPIPVTATPTEVKAVLGVNGMTITWKAIEGTGITYNVYRNDSGIKINTSPLTTTTFTDLLSAAGDYTYSVVAISASGVESTKSTVSAPVVLSVVKTRVSTGLDTYMINGIYVTYNKTPLNYQLTSSYLRRRKTVITQKRWSSTPSFCIDTYFKLES